MEPRGGTEILTANLNKYLKDSKIDQVNLMVSFCDHSILSNTKPNILWQHLNTDQRVAASLSDPQLVNRLDKIVFVSDWQRKKFCREFSIPLSKTSVIHNAIEPIEFVEKPRDGKIKLIYTSMPFRGLDILLDAFTWLNRQDVELVVFSSNIIYGKSYSTAVGRAYDHLFERCRRTPGVIYRGYAMNRAVRTELKNAHILAYPSTFEETSCLTAIEAGAAGCRIVTTDLGALTETCGEYADYVQMTNDRQELVENYAKQLNSSIDICRQNMYNVAEQSAWFNEQYSWVNRAEVWKKFFEEIC